MSKNWRGRDNRRNGRQHSTERVAAATTDFNKGSRMRESPRKYYTGRDA